MHQLPLVVLHTWLHKKVKDPQDLHVYIRGLSTDAHMQEEDEKLRTEAKRLKLKEKCFLIVLS